MYPSTEPLPSWSPHSQSWPLAISDVPLYRTLTILVAPQPVSRSPLQNPYHPGRPTASHGLSRSLMYPSTEPLPSWSPHSQSWPLAIPDVPLYRTLTILVAPQPVSRSPLQNPYHPGHPTASLTISSTEPLPSWSPHSQSWPLTISDVPLYRTPTILVTPQPVSRSPVQNPYHPGRPTASHGLSRFLHQERHLWRPFALTLFSGECVDCE